MYYHKKMIIEKKIHIFNGDFILESIDLEMTVENLKEKLRINKDFNFQYCGRFYDNSIVLKNIPLIGKKQYAIELSPYAPGGKYIL